MDINIKNANNKEIMTKYQKPFLTIDEQISLFEKRGLMVGDKIRASFFLRNISYFHLSIYAKAFQDVNDIFDKGTSFEDVLSLYNFDKKLRLLLLDVLERIEMSFKCVLAYEITKNKNDNYWYANSANYANEDEDLKKLLENVKSGKEIYLQHFFKKYSDSEFPPAWMFFESLTFGDCVRLARNFYEEDRQLIASFYKLSKGVIQMFYYLSHLRNTCAHHSRVWNRRFTMKVEKYKKYIDVFGTSPSDSLFSYLVILQILLARISPSSEWLERLDNLIKEYNIPIFRMGFPDDWREKMESIIK